MLEPQGILDPQALRNCFRELYGKEPRLFSAPGRVNLIGEHTDYNDGFVLPIAAHLRTYVAAAPRDDRLIQIYSSNLGTRGSFDLNEAPGSIQKHWYAYIEGVARQLVAAGFKLN